MNLEQFFELAKGYGVEGLVVALVVLVLVYLAKFSGLVKNGNVARIVNVIFAVVLGGYQFGDNESAFVSVIASIGSALLYTLIERISKSLRKQ